MHSPQWASSINSSLSKERNTWKNETNEKRQRSVHVPLAIGRPWAGNPPPRLQLPMPDLQLLRLDHAPALLAFERENRAYFAALVPDRGDEFFAEFDTRYAQLLAWQ